VSYTTIENDMFVMLFNCCQECYHIKYKYLHVYSSICLSCCFSSYGPLAT